MYIYRPEGLYKLNVRSGEEQQLTAIHDMYWYEDYKYNWVMEIGNWLYFNDYKEGVDLSGDYRGDLSDAVFRVHKETGVREEVEGDYWNTSYDYNVTQASRDTDGYYYLPSQKEGDSQQLIRIKENEEIIIPEISYPIKKLAVIPK